MPATRTQHQGAQGCPVPQSCGLWCTNAFILLKPHLHGDRTCTKLTAGAAPALYPPPCASPFLPACELPLHPARRALQVVHAIQPQHQRLGKAVLQHRVRIVLQQVCVGARRGLRRGGCRAWLLRAHMGTHRGCMSHHDGAGPLGRPRPFPWTAGMQLALMLVRRARQNTATEERGRGEVRRGEAVPRTAAQRTWCSSGLPGSTTSCLAAPACTGRRPCACQRSAPSAHCLSHCMKCSNSTGCRPPGAPSPPGAKHPACDHSTPGA